MRRDFQRLDLQAFENLQQSEKCRRLQGDGVARPRHPAYEGTRSPGSSVPEEIIPLMESATDS